MYEFSVKEVVDIFKAWLAITAAFGILLGRMSGSYADGFVISAVVVGLAFLVHELAHKLVAQYYRLKAEFRSFDLMLVLAVLMSFFGFVIAAPGAVTILSRTGSVKKWGRIAAAGPSANIVLGLIFLFLGFFISSEIIVRGIQINGWLALFNLIPAWLFDGKKIIRWSLPVWIVLFAFAFTLAFVV